MLQQPVRRSRLRRTWEPPLEFPVCTYTFPDPCRRRRMRCIRISYGAKGQSSNLSLGHRRSASARKFVATSTTPRQESSLFDSTVLPPSGITCALTQPPDHDRCQPIILSRHRPSGTDRVCLGEYDWGTAGMGQLQPKNTSDRLGWSNIRWIKFGFDVEFNPVLLIANGSVPDSDFERLPLLYRPNQKLFERVVETGPGSQEHE